MQMAMCRFRNVAVLDIYDAGFECQDNSSRNQHGKALDLRWEALDDPSSGVSTLTLLASCRRIRALQPRVFRLENVRNCKMTRVLDFLKLQLLRAELRLRRRLHESKVKTVCAAAGALVLSQPRQPWARAENKVSSLSSSVSLRVRPCLPQALVC